MHDRGTRCTFWMCSPSFRKPVSPAVACKAAADHPSGRLRSFFNSYVESLEMGAREGQNYAGTARTALW